MRKWIEHAVAFISVLLIIWGVVSFVEINTKNLTKNPTYWQGNMFIVITEIWGE